MFSFKFYLLFPYIRNNRKLNNLFFSFGQQIHMYIKNGIFPQRHFFGANIEYGIVSRYLNNELVFFSFGIVFSCVVNGGATAIIVMKCVFSLHLNRYHYLLWSCVTMIRSIFSFYFQLSVPITSYGVVL